MRLFNYRNSKEVGVGAEIGGEHISLRQIWGLTYGDAAVARGFPHTIDGLIERRMLRSGLPGDLTACFLDCGAQTRTRMRLPDAIELLTPLVRPGKILAIARNYGEHAAEMGSEAPSELRWFVKLPSTMIPAGHPIFIPRWLEGEVHHEAELGIVIGEDAYRVSAQQAPAHIAGYTIINDVTARGLQAEAKEKRMPWDAAKNLDSFCCVGPSFVLAESVPRPNALRVECRVNSQIRQQGSTADMIHSLGKIVSDLSHHLRLQAGDLIATGTPSGVGPLDDGDVCECEVEGIGVLTNPVVREV